MTLLNYSIPANVQVWDGRGWQALEEKPRPYAAGSWGPAASSALMAREGLSWFEES